MKRYAVIGASSGTGLALVRQLAAQQHTVRAISRRPPPAEPFIEPFAADVTDPAAMVEALNADFDAVFYTVDIHGLFKSRKDIRAVMVQGAVNTIQVLKRRAEPPKFVLLSVMGADKPSWVWWLLNAAKPGMQRNVLDREQALKDSGLRYLICRAPKLNDEPGGVQPLAVTAPRHRLDMSKGIARADLAQTLIRAAEGAPVNTIWDVSTGASGPVPEWL